MRDPTGFSLIELLIATAILSLLLGIGLVRFDPSRNELSQAALVLSQEVTRARFEAIKSNRMTELVIDASGTGGYSLCVDEDGDMDCTVAEVVSSTNFGEGDFPRTLLSATTLANDRIRFDQRGIPTESLLNRTITLESRNGNNARTLTLSATGRVEIQ